MTSFVTTTDDDEIASVAGELGSPVRRRSSDLATDDAPIVLATLDALHAVEQEFGETFDAVALIQPTAPLRRGSDLDAMVELLEDSHDADCVISVCSVNDVHPARMYRVDRRMRMRPLWPKWERNQRQQLPTLYLRNGVGYVTRRSTLVDEQRLIGSRQLAYVMTSEWHANIDDERDLLIVDALAERWDSRSAAGGGFAIETTGEDWFPE